MFEQMLLPTGGTHQARNAVVVFIAQAAFAAAAILILPALFVAQLPQTQLMATLIAPPPPPPPPPPPAPPAAAAKAPSRAQIEPKPRVFNYQRLVAPQVIPQTVPMIADNLPELSQPLAAGQAGGVPGGVLGGLPGGIPGGVPGGVGAAFTPPPQPQAPPPSAAQTPAQIRVGGDVQAARLNHQVVPTYPVIAREAHIGGTVVLSATIAPDGSVKDLRVLSGNPLLVTAAVDAVKQWTYRPTYLNGKPVEVLTEVDVRFTLG